MHLKVDVDKCIGAGQCVRVAPMTFAQNDDDGLVVQLEKQPPPERAASVHEAVRLCPARAIEIVDAPPGTESSTQG